MATVNIGNIKFNWKGPWQNGTTYAVDDVVSHSGSSYISIQAGAGQNPASASAYWQQMSSAGTNGTNGTDLTSTLTTQGDIVYRDGSGLARLGYGTAGQVLQTGGSGANPSWGTVSSDFVRITTNTLGSATTTWMIDNVFSATYKNYVIKINLRTGDSGHNIKFRYIDNSGSEVGSSNYRGMSGGGESTSSSANNTQAKHDWDDNGHQITGFGDSIGSAGTPNSLNLTSTLNIAYPYASSGTGYNKKSMHGLVTYTGGSGDRVLLGYCGGYYNGNLQARGFALVSSTGNGIGSDSMVAVYGLKS